MSAWELAGVASAMLIFTFTFFHFSVEGLIKRAERKYDENAATNPITLPANLEGDQKIQTFLSNQKAKYINEMRLTYRFFSGVLGVLITVFAVYVYTFRNQVIDVNTGTWGTFGDFFGGMLNPVLGFASFIALLYTIRLQSQELAMTREELARSADANEKSGRALVEQLNTLKFQTFENTFFKLLDAVENKIEAFKKTNFEVEAIHIELYRRDLVINCSETMKDVGFYDFIDYLTANCRVAAGVSRELITSGNNKSFVYLSNHGFDGKTVLIKLTGFSDSIKVFESYDFTFLDFYLGIFSYLEKSSLSECEYQVHIALLRGLIEPELAVVLAFYVNVPHNYSKREVVEKYQLLEQLPVDSETGLINEGIINIKDLNLDKDAFGKSIRCTHALMNTYSSQ